MGIAYSWVLIYPRFPFKGKGKGKGKRSPQLRVAKRSAEMTLAPEVFCTWGVMNIRFKTPPVLTMGNLSHVGSMMFLLRLSTMVILM